MKRVEAVKTGKCYCGCGGDTQSYFLPGHDLKAVKSFIKLEFGSIANLLITYGWAPKDATAATEKAKKSTARKTAKRGAK